MDFNFKEYVKGGIFILTNYFLFRQIIRRKRTVQKLQKIKNQQILSPKNALNYHKENNTRQEFLIKIIPHSFQEVKIRKSIYSNQIKFIEPSTVQIADKFTKLIKKSQKQNIMAKIKLQSINYNPKWTAKDQEDQTYSINGLGTIIDSNIFQIKSIYELKESGILKTIWKQICYALQYLLSYKNQQYKRKAISLNQQRKPHILGPVVGVIYYKLRLFTNKPVLLQAVIEDGKIISKMIGSSKLSFIEHLSNQILNSNIQIGLLTLASLISYRLIYKNIKKGIKQVFKHFKMRKHINKSKIKFFESQSADITDDKLCIICYNSCRNTIIFNCRHVIMCNQCLEAYHQQICPICKEQIDSFERFYQQ